MFKKTEEFSSLDTATLIIGIIIAIPTTSNKSPINVKKDKTNIKNLSFLSRSLFTLIMISFVFILEVLNQNILMARLLDRD